MSYDALDDFAGPGGWDEGARMVGLTTVGIEWDMAACQTAKAAGHARIRADVSVYPSAPFKGIPGYIGSPSCTLFSGAGSGVGMLVLDVLARGITRLFAGEDCRTEVRAAIYPVTLAEARAKNAKRADDKKWTPEKVETKARQDAFVASLVLEPARRIMALRPEWIALEQVPEVLPLWQVYVRELRALGYSAWTGVLNSANYGVPQTRERAVMMAHRSQQVAPPEPTHAAENHGGDLFGGSRAPWVTMAEALGWGATSRPSWTLCAPTSGGRSSFDGGSGMRRSVARTIESGHWAWSRPATTVVGSFKPEIIAAPGYRTTTSRQNAEGSVEVSITEAGVIQSFPPDYPWQGGKTKQHQQVGNAVPPLLAAHVLSALTGRPIASEQAA